MKRLAICIALFTMAACADIQNAPKPDEFYGDDKMVDIMADLYLMEASMTNNRATFTELKLLPHDFIYDKYDTDSITFTENLFYYTDRNDKYLELMEMVQAQMEVLRDTVDNKMKSKNNNSQKMLTPKGGLERDPDNE